MWLYFVFRLSSHHFGFVASALATPAIACPLTAAVVLHGATFLETLEVLHVVILIIHFGKMFKRCNDLGRVKLLQLFRGAASSSLWSLTVGGTSSLAWTTGTIDSLLKAWGLIVLHLGVCLRYACSFLFCFDLVGILWGEEDSEILMIGSKNVWLSLGWSSTWSLREYLATVGS